MSIIKDETTANKAKLSWKGGETEEFYVFFNTENNPNTAVLVKIVQTTYTDVELYSGNYNYFWVRSATFLGASDFSEGVYLYEEPGAVQNLKVSYVEDEWASFIWTAQNGKNAQIKYEIECINDSDDSVVLSETILQSNLLIEDLNANTNYTLSIKTIYGTTCVGEVNEKIKTLLKKTDPTIVEISPQEIPQQKNYTVCVPGNYIAYIVNINPNDNPLPGVLSQNIRTDKKIRKPAMVPSLKEESFKNEEGLSTIFSNGVERYEMQMPVFERPFSLTRTLKTPTFTPFKEGDTKIFNCDGSGTSEANWVDRKVPATMRYKGEHCYVWVANDNYNEDNTRSVVNNNKVKQFQVEIFGKAFDNIYPHMINMFGKKYSVQKTGKIAPNDKISIFLYDIMEDFSENQMGGVLGYFWGADMNHDYAIANELELINIDVHFVNIYPELAASTLAHEFQHMLRYVNKDFLNPGDETWVQEMMSMLCEDILQDKITLENYEPGKERVFIGDSESPKGRLYQFLCTYYDGGLFFWENKTMSYSRTYAFGAWLVRNYGGVKLLKEMATNSQIGLNCVISALQSCGVNKPVEKLLEEYVVSLLYNVLPADKAESYKLTTLYKDSPSETIAGQTYAFKAIDMSRYYYYNNNGAQFGLFAFPAEKDPAEYMPSINDVKYFCAGGFTVQKLYDNTNSAAEKYLDFEFTDLAESTCGVKTFIIMR